jgi:hypothetical protein
MWLWLWLTLQLGQNAVGVQDRQIAFLDFADGAASIEELAK